MRRVIIIVVATIIVIAINFVVRRIHNKKNKDSQK
jgi:hypothetical protein